MPTHTARVCALQAQRLWPCTLAYIIHACTFVSRWHPHVPRGHADRPGGNPWMQSFFGTCACCVQVTRFLPSLDAKSLAVLLLALSDLLYVPPRPWVCFALEEAHRWDPRPGACRRPQALYLACIGRRWAASAACASHELQQAAPGAMGYRPFLD